MQGCSARGSGGREVIYLRGPEQFVELQKALTIGISKDLETCSVLPLKKMTNVPIEK